MGKKKAEPEEEEFHVEVILKARVPDDIEGLDVAWEYLVKWYGYDDEDDNTWEPHDNISATCDRLLTSFWKEVGMDKEDYPPGYTITAPQEWIKKEKKYFRRILKEPDETPLTREEEEKVLPNGKYERKTKSSSSSAKSKRNSGSVITKRKRSPSSSSDSDVPLRKKVAKKRPKSPVVKNRNVKTDDATRLFISNDVPLSSAPLRSENKPESSASTSRPKLKVDTTTNATSSGRSSPAISSAALRQSSMKPSPSIPQRSTPALPHMKIATPVISQTTTPTIPQAKPPGPKLPAHRQPARVKELPFSAIGHDQAYSGLSTKKKLMLAGSIPSSSANVGFKATPLPPISFKKVKQGETTIGQDSSTFASTSAAPLSASTPTFPKGAPTFPPSLPFRKSTESSSVVATSTELAAEADQLLNDIGRDTGSSFPEDDSIMPHDDSWPPPEPLVTQKVPKIPRIPRHFNWEGDLYCSSGGSERSYGRVALSELGTGHGHADSMKLEQAFPRKLTSLKLSRFYHTSNILRQLRSMKDRSRFAALKAVDPASRNTVLVLANYSAKHSLAAVRFTEPTFENNIEGLLVFFHPSSPLLAGLRVPPQLPPDTLMVVAVISRIAPTPVATRIPPKLAPSRYLFPDTVHKHVLQRSIEILKFPLWLHSYLSRRPRSYCVWSNYKSSTRPPRLEHSRAGDRHETKMLRGILQQYSGQDVGLKKDVNLVFVHVSAVKSLHKLPAYVERIWKRVDVMFVMYGTHYTVPSSSWSMKRIYRSGGIVTFNPDGFLEDPLGVYNICCSIARHQFWAVRVIPSVLGMVVRKYYSENDSALLALDKGNFVYDFVVDAIDEGKFSFGRMPTVGPSWTRTKSEDWLAEQAMVLSGGPRSILEHALREFDAQYANIPPSDYARVVHDSIAEEIRLSQLHPTIMEEYRRYVVLGTEKETKTYTSDSFEYRTPASFEFNYKSSKSHPQPS